MAPSGFGHEEPRGARRENEPAPPDAPSDAPARPRALAVDPALLEQVLEHTALAVEQSETADPADVAALVEVARRHRGRALTAEPVIADMVGAVLGAQMRSWFPLEEDWRTMIASIARTLDDDPPSRRRLENLWAGLLEVAT
jgi:hypothetical protein